MSIIYTIIIIIGALLVTTGSLFTVAIYQLKAQIRTDDIAYIRALIDIKDEILFDIDCLTICNSWNKLKYEAALDKFKSTDPEDVGLLAKAKSIYDKAFKEYVTSLEDLTRLHDYVNIGNPKLEEI